MRADRVRFDPRTGDMTAEGAVEAELGGRRVRAERVRYSARSARLEVSNLQIEGALGQPGEVDSPSAETRRELATARGKGRGGVVAAFAPSGTPPTARLGAPWLEAEEAELREDLSRIRGRRGVRLGAGAIRIDGTAFDLDPAEGRLEVEAPVVKLRDPRCTVVARRLLARDAGGDSPEILLEGDVVARLALPLGPRGQEVRLEAIGQRLLVRREGRSVAFRLSGEPLRIVAPEGELELEGRSVRGLIKRRSISIDGPVTGKLVVVASAFPERQRARRPWTVVAASAISILPPTARSSWAAGPAPSRLPGRIVLEDARLGEAPRLDGSKESVVARLELFRPTWRRA